MALSRKSAQAGAMGLLGSFLVIALLSGQAVGSPAVTPAIWRNYTPPFSATSVASDQQGTVGCGASLGIGQAGVFNTTNGRAQIDVNTSATTCGAPAADAYYNSTLGISSLKVTTPSSKLTTFVDARWKMYGWVNTSAGGPIHSSNKSRGGLVTIIAYMAVLNSSTGLILGSKQVQILSQTSTHLFKSRAFTGNLTALIVSIPMTKGVTYVVESWLVIHEFSVVKSGTANGNFAWADVHMLQGSLLSDVQLH